MQAEFAIGMSCDKRHVTQAGKDWWELLAEVLVQDRLVASLIFLLNQLSSRSKILVSFISLNTANMCSVRVH